MANEDGSSLGASTRAEDSCPRDELAAEDSGCPLEENCLVEELSQLGTYLKEGRQLALDLAAGKLGAIDEGMFTHDNPLIPPLEEIQSNLARALSIVKAMSTRSADVYVGSTNGYTEALDEALSQLNPDDRAALSRRTTDPLTGVGNWTAYNEAVEALWAAGRPFTASFIDLDNLKQCNDLFGYVDGDRYIASTCQRLRRMLAPGESLFRIGGDGFVILSESSSEQQLSDRLEQCRTDLIAESSRVGSRAVFSFSYGCRHVDPTAGSTRHEASREIDRALTCYKIANKPSDVRNAYSTRDGLPDNGFIDRLFNSLSRAHKGSYLFIRNCDTGATRFSPNAVTAFGLESDRVAAPADALLGSVHPDDRAELSSALKELEEGFRTDFVDTFRARDRFGACMVRNLKIVRLDGAGDEAPMLIGTMENVEHVADIDGVTGLEGNEALRRFVGEMREKSAPAGFAMVKLARLAEVNERFGFKAGDRLLSEVARVMQELSHEGTRVFRARGVRIVACAEGVGRGDADRFAEAIAARLAEPVEIDGVEVSLLASVAAAYYPKIDRASFAILTELDRRADVRMRDDFGTHGRPTLTSIVSRERIDGVTGLSFEDEFLSRAEALRGGRPDITWAMVKIDLGHMRVFNEWYGDAVGDRLIADIGAALKGFEDEGAGVAGYWGEDDFSLFTPFDGLFIDDLYLKLCSVVYDYDGAAGFRPSIGIYCLAPNEKVSLDQYTKALFAAHRAKRRLQNRISMFRPVEYAKDQAEQEVLVEFKRALSDGRIFFHLQPQCDLATGEIVGAEALARMRREDGTFVSPAEFVPVLEKTQLIELLDKHIWRALFAWQRDRMLAGKRLLPVSLNVSRIDLLSFDVPGYLDTLIAHYGVPASCISAEITETACTLQMDDVRELVTALDELGVKVHMDDFGSGQSSLNMLRGVDVDAIKLDRAFLLGGKETAGKGESIIQSIMDLSRSLDVPVIVEGVETEEQVQMMRRLGAEYAQGFYFYRPMSPDAFAALLDDE